MTRSKGHSHGSEKAFSDARLVAAIALNLLLTVVEVAVGILSGGLALIADAVHNFNDCASLGITLGARVISRKEADRRRTFGYRRAEVIGALINLTLLIVVGLFLLYEAASRYFSPRQVEGWLMVVAASVALLIDLATVLFLYGMAKGSLNLRAGFLHKLSDALASVGVIAGGVIILLWQLAVVSLVVTAVIAGYILWQGFSMMGETIAVLMESVPADVDIDQLVEDLKGMAGVQDIHHLHVWELDEQHRALEAHIVIHREDAERLENVKRAVKGRIEEKFGIAHSTLEFEFDAGHCNACR